MTALSALLKAHVPKEIRSNRELAKLVGISRGTIDNYMAGRHPANPSDEVLNAFHLALHIPIQELRDAAGQPHGESQPWEPPSEANLMDRRQRDAVTELIRSFVATQGGTADGTATDPTTPPPTPPTRTSGTRKPAKKTPSKVVPLKPADQPKVLDEDKPPATQPRAARRVPGKSEVQHLHDQQDRDAEQGDT